MKKALIVIELIICFILIYFLQVDFFSWFTIFGIMPNLFVLYILFIGLFGGKTLGILLGVLFGLLLDLFIGKTIGISSIMLALIGFAGGYFDRNFSKESRMTIMLTSVAATATYEIGTYLINLVIQNVTFELIIFIRILLIELLYNTLLVIILHPLAQKVGYYIENIFRGPQILTRYFG